MFGERPSDTRMSPIQTSNISAAVDRGALSFGSVGDGTLELRLSGRWCIGSELQSATTLNDRLGEAPGVKRITLTASELTAWDSVLLTFLLNVIGICKQRNIQIDRKALPSGVNRLLDLATAVPEQDDVRRPPHGRPMLAQIGGAVIGAAAEAKNLLGFIGEATVALAKLVRGRARFRRRDLMLAIQECGVQALPIVTLISFLIGLILAFVGAVQLKQFGAEIYVADLVGIAMVREFAAVMTGIIMAGRTGAAFAAELGTMTVNEEIDAFKTLGFSPMEFLVLPRMLALALMMPLLVLYANVVGILGGLVVGVGMLDLSPTLYWNQTLRAIDLGDLMIGLSKSIIFGILVALAGCLRGIQCGRSSAAVGIAVTSAVVTGIVAIIVSDAIFAVGTNMIGM